MKGLMLLCLFMLERPSPSTGATAMEAFTTGMTSMQQAPLPLEPTGLIFYGLDARRRSGSDEEGEEHTAMTTTTTAMTTTTNLRVLYKARKGRVGYATAFPFPYPQISPFARRSSRVDSYNSDDSPITTLTTVFPKYWTTGTSSSRLTDQELNTGTAAATAAGMSSPLEIHERSRLSPASTASSYATTNAHYPQHLLDAAQVDTASPSSSSASSSVSSVSSSSSSTSSNTSHPLTMHREIDQATPREPPPFYSMPFSTPRHHNAMRGSGFAGRRQYVVSSSNRDTTKYF